MALFRGRRISLGQNMRERLSSKTRVEHVATKDVDVEEVVAKLAIECWRTLEREKLSIACCC